MQIQSTFDIENTNISNTLYQKIYLDEFPIFIWISTHVIRNYKYLKVNFLEPENLFWDICSLEWTLTLRYRELTIKYSEEF